MVITLLLHPQRNSDPFACPFLQTWTTTTQTSLSGEGTSAESSKSPWWKWVQTVSSLAQAHVFSVLEECHGEGVIVQRNDRKELEHMRNLSNICIAEPHACRHVIDAVGEIRLWTNTWALPLLREECGSSWQSSRRVHDEPLVSVKSATVDNTERHSVSPISKTSCGFLLHKWWA